MQPGDSRHANPYHYPTFVRDEHRHQQQHLPNQSQIQLPISHLPGQVGATDSPAQNSRFGYNNMNSPGETGEHHNSTAFTGMYETDSNYRWRKVRGNLDLFVMERNERHLTSLQWKWQKMSKSRRRTPAYEQSAYFNDGPAEPATQDVYKQMPESARARSRAESRQRMQEELDTYFYDRWKNADDRQNDSGLKPTDDRPPTENHRSLAYSTQNGDKPYTGYGNQHQKPGIHYTENQQPSKWSRYGYNNQPEVPYQPAYQYAQRGQAFPPESRYPEEVSDPRGYTGRGRDEGSNLRGSPPKRVDRSHRERDYPGYNMEPSNDGTYGQYWDRRNTRYPPNPYQHPPEHPGAFHNYGYSQEYGGPLQYQPHHHHEFQPHQYGYPTPNNRHFYEEEMKMAEQKKKNDERTNKLVKEQQQMEDEIINLRKILSEELKRQSETNEVGSKFDEKIGEIEKQLDELDKKMTDTNEKLKETEMERMELKRTTRIASGETTDVLPGNAPLFILGDPKNGTAAAVTQGAYCDSLQDEGMMQPQEISYYNHSTYHGSLSPPSSYTAHQEALEETKKQQEQLKEDLEMQMALLKAELEQQLQEQRPEIPEEVEFVIDARVTNLEMQIEEMNKKIMDTDLVIQNAEMERWKAKQKMELERRKWEEEKMIHKEEKRMREEELNRLEEEELKRRAEEQRLREIENNKPNSERKLLRMPSSPKVSPISLRKNSGVDGTFNEGERRRMTELLHYNGEGTPKPEQEEVSEAVADHVLVPEIPSDDDVIIMLDDEVTNASLPSLNGNDATTEDQAIQNEVEKKEETIQQVQLTVEPVKSTDTTYQGCDSSHKTDTKTTVVECNDKVRAEKLDQINTKASVSHTITEKLDDKHENVTNDFSVTKAKIENDHSVEKALNDAGSIEGLKLEHQSLKDHVVKDDGEKGGGSYLISEASDALLKTNTELGKEVDIEEQANENDFCIKQETEKSTSIYSVDQKDSVKLKTNKGTLKNPKLEDVLSKEDSMIILLDDVTSLDDLKHPPSSPVLLSEDKPLVSEQVELKTEATKKHWGEKVPDTVGLQSQATIYLTEPEPTMVMPIPPKQAVKVIETKQKLPPAKPKEGSIKELEMAENKPVTVRKTDSQKGVSVSHPKALLTEKDSLNLESDSRKKDNILKEETSARKPVGAKDNVKAEESSVTKKQATKVKEKLPRFNLPGFGSRKPVEDKKLLTSPLKSSEKKSKKEDLLEIKGGEKKETQTKKYSFLKSLSFSKHKEPVKVKPESSQPNTGKITGKKSILKKETKVAQDISVAEPKSEKPPVKPHVAKTSSGSWLQEKFSKVKKKQEEIKLETLPSNKVKTPKSETSSGQTDVGKQKKSLFKSTWPSSSDAKSKTTSNSKSAISSDAISKISSSDAKQYSHKRGKGVSVDREMTITTIESDLNQLDMETTPVQSRGSDWATSSGRRTGTGWGGSRHSMLEGLGTSWCVCPKQIWKHLGDENDDEPITRRKCISVIMAVILALLLLSIVIGLIIGIVSNIKDEPESPIKFVVIPGTEG
uniref:myosin-11 isoform X3 n=1 Tax=Ciona intestinalis TaxID=7719 RepID=UPI000EF4843B|nr:myosin-11 isoform X3 [Ciona intestinalis]|eukprot:XP_026691575.1 myosin-11 isoform X3 [Ciona intestinalis]